MDYCAYCGAKMQETADSCPVCGKWRQQVQLAGGGATVREPRPEEKTKIFDRRSASPAAENRARQAEQAAYERQSRRETQGPSSRTGAYYRGPERPYHAPAENYDDWQALSDQHYVPQWDKIEGAHSARSYDGGAYAPREDEAAYDRAPQRNSGGRQTREGSPYQQNRSASGRSASGQTRQGSGGRSAYQGGRQTPGGQNRPRQGSGRKPRSAMQQLQSDVAPAMREVRSRVQQAAGGVATAIRDPGSSQRRLLSVVGIAAAAVIVLLILIKLFTGGGEKAMLKKLAKAYESQKPEAVEALASDLMKAFNPGDKFTADCRDAVGTIKDYFSGKLGSRYHISYKIEINENYTGAALAQEMENTFGDFYESYDKARVKEMTKATLTLKAKGGGHTARMPVQVILVKEDGKWRLASQNLK